MATLSFYLDRRSVKKDGTSPLKAMVNVRKETLLFPMGIDLLPIQWNNDKKLIVKHPRKAFLNSYLNEMIVKAEDSLMTEQKKQGTALSKIQVKDLMSSLFCNCKEQDGNVVVMFKRMINDKSKRKRTQEIYEVTLRKIEKYLGKDANSLTFEDINLKWLKKFEEWLTTDCPHVNARAIHFRNLRAVFNKAIEEDLTSNYPFRKFKRGQLVTSRHALAMETGLSEKVIRRCLRQLERTGEIRTKPTHHYSLITVVKYTEYQGDSTTMGPQKASEGPAIGQQRATIEEEKNEIKEESALLCPSPSEEHLMVDTEMDIRQFMNFFNHTMLGKRIPQIEGINAVQKDLLNACCREYGKDALFTVVQKAAASSFLNGGGRSSFLARFDWIFKPSNFRKILEGNYDDNVKPDKNNYGTGYTSGYRSADDIIGGATGIILDLRSGSDEAQGELPVV